MVVPVDVLEGGDLDLVVAAPGSSGFDQFGLEQPDCGLGQSIIVGIRHRADRGVDAGGGKTFGEGDRRVLTAGVVMVDQSGQVGGAVPAAGPDRHLEGVEDQGGLHAGGGAPAEGAARVDVDDDAT